MIVEVCSSSNSRPKDKAKRTRYFDNGAEIIWDINEKSRIIYVYRIDSQDEPDTYKVGDEIDCEPLLPGWRRQVSDIFAEDVSLDVMFSEVVTTSRKEGRKEGVLLGKQDMLIHLLQSQFMNVSESILDTIKETNDLAQLDLWFNQALAAHSLDEMIF